MTKVKKCAACNRYTLQDRCPECDGEVRDPEPPKFSFPDRYGEYRRQTKEEQNDG